MPFITAYLRDSAENKILMKRSASKITQIVSEELQYTVEDVALLPHFISSIEVECGTNLPKIEFHVDAGNRVSTTFHEDIERIKRRLVKETDLWMFTFGLWIRPYSNSAYTNHSPSESD
jgi:predicted nucleotidyltransferase